MNTADRPVHERMILYCIETLCAFLDWLPAEIIIENNVVEGLLCLLNSPSITIRLAACEAVLVIVNRKFSDVEQLKNCILKPFLSDAAFEIFASAWNGANGMIKQSSDVADIETHLDEDYPFLKRFAQVWVDMGTEQLCHKKLEALPAELPKFLELCIMLSRHASMKISSLGFSLWHAFFKDPMISKSEQLQLYCQPLFDVIAEKMNRLLFIPSDEDSASLGSRYSFADYEDSLADFQTAFGNYRSVLYQMTRHTLEQHALYALNYCSQVVTQLTAMPFPNRDDPQFVKETGILTTNSPFYIVWESQTSLLSAVTGSLPTELVKGPWVTPKAQQERVEAMKLVRAMLQTLLQYQSNDPLIIGRQLDSLTCFAEMLASEPSELALSLLQKVFSFVTFTLPSEPKVVDETWRVSEDTTALRRKACTSLLRLATGIPDVLLGIYTDIQREIQRLFTQQLVSYVEKSQLEEFLAAIIVSTDLTPEQKIAQYNTVFEPMLQEILNESIHSALGSMDQFLEAVGIKEIVKMIQDSRGPTGTVDMQAKINLTPERQAILRKNRMRRSRLGYIVNVYKGCLTRTVRAGKSDLDPESRQKMLQQSPWAVNFHKVLPLYLILVRHIHMLWDSKVWMQSTGLPAELASILSMSSLERSIILGKSTTEAAEQEQQRTSHPPYSIDDYIYHLRNWFRLMREAVYGLLGQAAYMVPGDYFYGPPAASLAPLNCSNPTLSQALMENMFCSVTSLSNFHWRSLIIFFIRPFVTSCPKEHFQDVLAPILPPLMTFLGNKLNAEWKEVVDRGLAQMGSIEEAEMMASSESSLQQATLDAGASDEIVHQKVLRDLTRVWTDIWSAVFAPHTSKSSTPPTCLFFI